MFVFWVILPEGDLVKPYLTVVEDKNGELLSSQWLLMAILVLDFDIEVPTQTLMREENAQVW